MPESEEMPELVRESLIKFSRRQLEIVCAWIVDSILKSSVQYGSGGNDFSGGGIESTLKSEPDDFGRQTQPVKNAPVGIEHDRTLSSAIAGVRVRGLAGNITCHGKEVVDGLHVTIDRKSTHGEKATRIGDGKIGGRHGRPIGEHVLHAGQSVGVVNDHTTAVWKLAQRATINTVGNRLGVVPYERDAGEAFG